MNVKVIKRKKFCANNKVFRYLLSLFINQAKRQKVSKVAKTHDTSNSKVTFWTKLKSLTRLLHFHV